MERRIVIVRIYYEITTACNLQCAYCFEKEYSTHTLPFAKLKNFHSKLGEGVSDIVITGGEPFMHPEIFEVLEWLPLNCPVVVTTNGTRGDTERIVDLLKRFPNLHIQISLDSLSTEIMERLRGKNVLDKILSLLEKSIDFCGQISLSATVVKANIDSVKELIDFAQSRGIAIYFPELIPFGNLLANWRELMPAKEDYSNYEDFLLSVISEDTRDLISSNKFDRILARYFVNGHNEHTIKVDAKGNIIICPAADAGCPAAILGSIDDIGCFADLQNVVSEKPVCISAQLLSENCDNCKHARVCSGIFCGNCKYMNIADKGVLECICHTYYHHFDNISRMES